MNKLRQLQAYKRHQVTTTDSATALLLLYQGTIDSLNRARASMATGDMAVKGREILRANDIINQFLLSLDYEIGGELVSNLEALYLYMLEQILLANVKNDPAPLIVVVSLLSTLKAGWEEATAIQREQVAAQGKKRKQVAQGEA